MPERERGARSAVRGSRRRVGVRGVGEDGGRKKRVSGGRGRRRRVAATMTLPPSFSAFSNPISPSLSHSCINCFPSTQSPALTPVFTTPSTNPNPFTCAGLKRIQLARMQDRRNGTRRREVVDAGDVGEKNWLERRRTRRVKSSNPTQTPGSFNPTSPTLNAKLAATSAPLIQSLFSSFRLISSFPPPPPPSFPSPNSLRFSNRVENHQHPIHPNCPCNSGKTANKPALELALTLELSA
ncbi:hypothetical protein BCR35DRAFT_301491 [Leucosporidium creatinivorum]|uniref:Uncharacterized protein n=1 Tax=Leucosporidium creatinivorum TaxID=106004 RepID=A0A1Y2FXW4_9BASI|nr:hypothetical protein BCR35DRAFT_301491 [Leucosporidium creatinivorum]